jgi:hypothetical protein
MNYLIVILRLIHILSGMFWIGSIALIIALMCMATGRYWRV